MNDPASFDLNTVLHKRYRRHKYEIKRIYICGYEGCTKGYGRKAHLVTHQKIKCHFIY